MRILIFCWRDIKNPKAGGAEIFTHEIARRWVKMGHEVSIISARFIGGKPQETVHGVMFFRPALFHRYAPNEYLRYLLINRSFYKNNFQGKVDIVIDQVHGLPLFSKFYVKEKLVALPHEIAKKIWFYEIPFPYSFAGFILEFLYLMFYRRTPFITVSPSTAKDLKEYGIKNITVVPEGISFKPISKIGKKSKEPLILSLGRITKMKRIEHTIQAFKIVNESFPKSKLVISGRGSDEYVKQLRQLVKNLHLEDKVEFLGYTNEKRKFGLLKRAWVLVSSSVHEGWGIVIIEANACGTPTVTYKIPGLVDSVKDKKTGLICANNCPENLAKNINLLLQDRRLRTQLSKSALEYSRQFSWERAAEESLKFLERQ